LGWGARGTDLSLLQDQDSIQGYQTTMKFGRFTGLLALLLQETLHKRITQLTAKKIIPISMWASQNGIKPNVAANKAKRQTIPAFRLREKWMIAQEYNPGEN